jgi:2-C-methyl-D-erythritol 2,4-cyclodiphosphate synthase
MFFERGIVLKQRVGIGYDIHRLIEGRKLVIGSVEIPYFKGLEGHSDADVLLHAICDAILGALGKGDIGEHFPNTDQRFKDISSLTLLEKVSSMAKEEKFIVGNVDCVIQAEEPNFKEYKPQMRQRIAGTLGIDEAAVNIKATTMEQLGAVGNKEGIAALATVLLLSR